MRKLALLTILLACIGGCSSSHSSTPKPPDELAQVCERLQNGPGQAELGQLLAGIFSGKSASARREIPERLQTIERDVARGPAPLRESAARLKSRLTTLLEAKAPSEHQVDATQQALNRFGQEVERTCG
ncbi:hypothetical protein AB0J80_11805 [Actinoplanes sp. NPDC049548]|uniref:hypothetical protein n=1 Tax=Actinoplanes sp. NPDC049548 TaxID=3155152 RepID=UPI00344419B8